MAEQITIKYLNDNVNRIAVNRKGNWIDLCAAETVTLKAGEFALIHLGVAMKLPEGYEAHLVPRSSTFKNWGILQTNHMGVIDNSYCGSNDWWKMPVYATRDVTIEGGSRICQFRIERIQPEIEFIVGELGGEDRGGFGSTGVK